MDIETYLKEKRHLIDSYLKTYFSFSHEPSMLYEAMRYSLFAGGKRIRPILALASYEACRGDPENILPYASALELIHTYSLIHDDLPAMDDDDLRRGKPTNHKVFGEAIAILAGDALLTEAFCMLSNIKKQNFKNSSPGDTQSPPISEHAILRVIREVAIASGACGMIGGQAQDILSENSKPDRDTLYFIHLHKTAALITASVRMGPILAESDEGTLKTLTKYGENIGLAFQIVDDILDIEGDSKELGKRTGSNGRMKKMTYPALLGVKKSREKAKDLISEAVEALRIYSSEADPLRGIAHYLIKRRH
ncbi:MAG: polyprenyl synthetase family protein [Nitrospirota bacterium]